MALSRNYWRRTEFPPLFASISTPWMHLGASLCAASLSSTTSTTRHGHGRAAPHKGMKLLASHPDATPRDVFLHCNDVVPTIYEIIGIQPPLVVNCAPQMPVAGASFARTLTDRSADGGKKTQ